MNTALTRPVLGFAAYSGTGKTTLLVKLLPLLKEQGVQVAMIKHAHHNFDIDQAGKDSFMLRKAGADQMLIASSFRNALITETPKGDEPVLDDLINKLNLESVDLVLVEGFRHLAFPKIEIHRPSTGKELIFPYDDNVIAIVSDEKIESGNLVLLNLNQPQEIAAYIHAWLSSQ